MSTEPLPGGCEDVRTARSESLCCPTRLPVRKEGHVFIETVARRLFTGFNAVEGLFWLSLAATFLTVAWRRRQNTGLAIGAGLLFATFGLSDFVEIHTGGWYKPWWLLAWKATNLIGLVLVYIAYRRQASHSSTGTFRDD